MTLKFGTAPDSWGVWLADHPTQPLWPQFLDEAASTGHHLIELGPYGYLPTDPGILAHELSSRGQSLIAATMVAENMHAPAHRADILAEVRKIAALAGPLGAKYFVLMAEGYLDSQGKALTPTSLEGGDWTNFVDTCDEAGRLLLEEYGMVLAFHPHADSVVEYAWQVDKLLDDSDARFTQLCLDTGHYEYRDGDSAALLRERFSRIPYLHLKSVEAAVRLRAIAEGLSFGDAVGYGVACEPSVGSVDFAAIAKAIEDINWNGFAIVEQDMFPLPSLDIPAPIAKRSREFYNSLGWTN
jgi:inosose dehydratase